MGKNDYLTSEDLYFSLIFGRNIYRETGQMVKDPFHPEAGESPLIENVLTGRQFFLRLAESGNASESSYNKFLMRHPRRSNILWPEDIIQISDDHRKGISLYAANKYLEDQINPSLFKCTSAYIFPYEDYGKLIPGEEKFKQLIRTDWQTEKNRRAAVSILNCIRELNEDDYVYGDFHFSRFFFREDGSCFLDFSNLLFYSGYHGFFDYAVDLGEFPLEFAEPCIVSRSRGSFDQDSQNYSLTAMLFYLLFGRYPYDGKAMVGNPDNNIQQHYARFRAYHQIAMFIFDPDNHSNEIGLFGEEADLKDSWEEAPELIRKMFTDTLVHANAMRQTAPHNYSAREWLQAFEKVGWK